VAFLPHSSRITELVKNNLNFINKITQALKDLSQHERQLQRDPMNYQDMIAQWHFSDYQKKVLMGYLRRFEVLFPQKDSLALCKKMTTSKDVLFLLESSINSLGQK
jgi:hypothetical protein